MPNPESAPKSLAYPPINFREEALAAERAIPQYSAFPRTVRDWNKLQALVYDILPSTTAVFSYAKGSRKLSANEQFLLLVLKQ